jgi:hypothetical protein
MGDRHRSSDHGTHARQRRRGIRPDIRYVRLWLDRIPEYWSSQRQYWRHGYERYVCKSRYPEHRHSELEHRYGKRHFFELWNGHDKHARHSEYRSRRQCRDSRDGTCGLSAHGARRKRIPLAAPHAGQVIPDSHFHKTAPQRGRFVLSSRARYR